MAEKLKQKDFKEFEKAFNRIRRENRQEREDAVGLLTPSLLRKHIKSGQDLVLDYGRKGHTVTYNLAELKEFAKHIGRHEGRKKKEVAGVPLIKLEKISWRDDKIRIKQIKNATLYRFLNNILHFQVSASGKTGKSHYQVKIRLEEWYNYMTGTLPWLSVARATAVGRLSFDCTCGRHQYWFRYLATIGNFAITPKEKDFPKIRNPRLGGACCKHVLKVLQQLKSPSVHVLIAREMERQSKAVGYVDKGQTKFLTPKELAKARRARGTGKESLEAKRAYQEFVKARKAFAKKLREAPVADQLRAQTARTRAAERKTVKIKKKLEKEAAKTKTLEKKLEQAEADKIISSLKTAIDIGTGVGGDRDKIIDLFAKNNEMLPSEVNAIAEEYNL